MRLLANVERMAMPSAPPICCDVLNRPDARPASSRPTFVVAISVSGTNTNPSPMPMTMRPGRTSGTYDPVAVANDQEQEPDRSHDMPASATSRIPTRPISALREPRRAR